MSDARVIARDHRDTLGEGLLWVPRENAVYWVDILEKRVHRLGLAHEEVTTWELPDVVGWLVEREQGGFIAGVGRAFVKLTLDPVRVETIAAPEPELDGNRFNDAKADAKGRIYGGSMPFACDKPSGSFYRLDPDGRATRLEAGYTIPNGPAIGRDFILSTDTALGTIFRYPLHDNGSVGERAPFITFDKAWGNPDGMTFDADSHLWVACWGGSQVLRFDPAGKRERAIALPASQITNVCFAGEGLDRMFVTSAKQGVAEKLAGSLFEVDPGCRGTVPYKYKG